MNIGTEYTQDMIAQCIEDLYTGSLLSFTTPPILEATPIEIMAGMLGVDRPITIRVMDERMPSEYWVWTRRYV